MNPTPRKLALLMALAGFGMSLPATVGATADSRAAPSRASLDEVFGFRGGETRKTSAPRDRDDALSRLNVLGLAGPPSATGSGDLPLPEHALQPSNGDAWSSSQGGPTVLAVPTPEVESPLEAQVESTGDTPDAEAATVVRAAPATTDATAAATADSSADAMTDALANALALVVIVEESAPAHPSAPSSAEMPAFMRGPTAGRPPRTAADARVELWAGPVATALPDFELDLCAIDTLPARNEANEPTTALRPVLDVDLDSWADAMQEPFETDAAAQQAADVPAGISTEFTSAITAPSAITTAITGPAALTTAGTDPTAITGANATETRITSVDIDLRGIGIGMEPDIDLGRAPDVESHSSAEVDLDLSMPAPAAAPTPREAAPAPSKPAVAMLGVAVAEAVSEAKLDRVRGGFSSTDGLQVSFGIERAVYVNGALVTTTSLNVSGLGNTTGGPPAATASAGQIALVQNGAGNTFQTGSMNAAALGTVVQNTLNNQKIQTVTLINATVNSLQIIKSMNIGSSLRGAMIDSLRR